MQWNAMECNGMQCNVWSSSAPRSPSPSPSPMECKAMQRNATQCNAMQLPARAMGFHAPFVAPSRLDRLSPRVSSVECRGLLERCDMCVYHARISPTFSRRSAMSTVTGHRSPTFAASNAMQCNAMQCNAMQCNAMQCNVMSCHAV